MTEESVTAQVFGLDSARGDGDRTRDAQAAWQLLADVEAFFARLLAFPSEHARVAAVLWTAHAHAVEAFESTPRLAYLSPEPGSGKTRALEVHAVLVPNPMHAVNATPAALFRRVGDRDRPVTLLFDEIDTVFGPKAKENEELRALLNAGHRRSGVAYRCVGEGTKQFVQEFPAFAPLALAGIGDLPDTIMSRAVIVRMRRRAPSEPVEPFRARFHEPEGNALRDRLARWAVREADAWREAIPDMPDGVTDRPADVWEPLLVVADTAGGAWPARARAACRELTKVEPGAASLGLQLLGDVRTVFAGGDRMATADLVKGLCDLAEAPWDDLRGKALDARALAWRLGKYDVHPRKIRVGDATVRGYLAEDLYDAWQRYLPPPGEEAEQAERPEPARSQGVLPVPDAERVPEHAPGGGTENSPLTSGVPPVPHVPPSRQGGDGGARCPDCDEPPAAGRRVHAPRCPAVSNERGTR